MKMATQERQPTLEDNLKLLIVEYVNNPWSEIAQIQALDFILNFAFGTKPKFEMKMITHGRQNSWRTTWKYIFWNISPTTNQILLNL